MIMTECLPALCSKATGAAEDAAVSWPRAVLLLEAMQEKEEPSEPELLVSTMFKLLAK